MIYYKQEKFNLADVHFRKALSINPSSSVLYCHVGVVSKAAIIQHYSDWVCTAVMSNDVMKDLRG